jgi:hypothetical protein
MKTNKTLTKDKIKRAESANLKDIATNILYRRLTLKCSVIPPQLLASTTEWNPLLSLL